jgi:hypothetical protein
VAASWQANCVRVAELKNRMKSLNPFALAKAIDQKLERIYKLANRRLSPKVPKELPVPEQNKSSRRNGAPSPSVTLQMARRCALRLHS